MVKTNYENYNKLTNREKEVVFLFCSMGRSKQQIADSLNIGLATVTSHLYSIYKKKDLHTVQQLMYWHWSEKWDKAFEK